MAGSYVVAHPQNITHRNCIPCLLAHLAAHAIIQRLTVVLAAAGEQEELPVRVLGMEIAGQKDLAVLDDDGFRSDANG